MSAEVAEVVLKAQGIDVPPRDGDRQAEPAPCSSCPPLRQQARPARPRAAGGPARAGRPAAGRRVASPTDWAGRTRWPRSVLGARQVVPVLLTPSDRAAPRRRPGAVRGRHRRVRDRRRPAGGQRRRVDRIEGRDRSIRRIAGPDRYETSLAVAGREPPGRGSLRRRAGDRAQLPRCTRLRAGAGRDGPSLVLITGRRGRRRSRSWLADNAPAIAGLDVIGGATAVASRSCGGCGRRRGRRPAVTARSGRRASPSTHRSTSEAPAATVKRSRRRASSSRASTSRRRPRPVARPASVLSHARGRRASASSRSAGPALAEPPQGRTVGAESSWSASAGRRTTSSRCRPAPRTVGPARADRVLPPGAGAVQRQRGRFGAGARGDTRRPARWPATPRRADAQDGELGGDRAAQQLSSPERTAARLPAEQSSTPVTPSRRGPAMPTSTWTGSGSVRANGHAPRPTTGSGAGRQARVRFPIVERREQAAGLSSGVRPAGAG